MEFVIFIDSFSAVNTHFFITPQFVFPTSWAHFHVLKRISIFLNSFLFFFCASLTHHLIGICLFLSASYTYSIFFTILISFIQVLKEPKRFYPGKLRPFLIIFFPIRYRINSFELYAQSVFCLLSRRFPCLFQIR